MNFDNITLEKANGIGYVTINRPKKLNALNKATIEELHAAFLALEEDNEMRVVILTGSGEKAFCAGGDVVSLRKQVLDEGGPPTELSEKFFYDEYLLNYKINIYNTLA